MELAAAATFYKNTGNGYNAASSFEVLYGSIQNLSTICNPIDHESFEDTLKANRERQIQLTLDRKTRNHPPVNVGEALYFRKDTFAW